MRPVPPPALIASGGLKCMRSRRGAARSVAAPLPPRHARPSLRLGWAAAPAPACRGVPPALAPVAPGARRAVCAQGFLSAASGRPCAPLCVSPLCAAPSLARAGLWGAVGRPRAPPPWARARFGRGRRCPPAPPPSGVRALSLPRGGLLLARLAPRLFVPPSPPRGLGLVLPPLRRRRVCVLLFRRVAGLWAGAALLCSCARSMLHQACACCPHSRCLTWALVSPPEKIEMFLRRETLRKRYAAPLPYPHTRIFRAS